MMENLPRIILERPGIRVVRLLRRCTTSDHCRDRLFPASECERCFAVELKSRRDAMGQPIWRPAADDDGYRLTSILKEIAADMEKKEAK